MGVRGCFAIKCRKEGVGCNLKWRFLQTFARRRAGKTKRRTFLPARPRMRDFEFSLAILPSCHLKAFFDILRQKNDNDNEDENGWLFFLSYIRFEEFEEFRIIIAD